MLSVAVWLNEEGTINFWGSRILDSSELLKRIAILPRICSLYIFANGERRSDFKYWVERRSLEGEKEEGEKEEGEKDYFLLLPASVDPAECRVRTVITSFVADTRNRPVDGDPPLRCFRLNRNSQTIGSMQLHKSRVRICFAQRNNLDGNEAPV